VTTVIAHHEHDSVWSQASLGFVDYSVAQQVASAHLAPILMDAEERGLLTCWFFTRKNPVWRLRFAASPENGGEVEFVHTRFRALVDAGYIASATKTIYEPEVHAFGGPKGMATAHRLFHSDSRLVLAHYGGRCGPIGYRELSVLLCSGLLRGAGQDWYEQGDIWTRVAEHQAPLPDCSPDHVQRLRAQVRRLMITDTSPAGPLLAGTGPLTEAAAWIAAFTGTGRALRQLAIDGALHRGLRAVLAHQVLFHWNRLGLDPHTKTMLAHRAAEVVFADDDLPPRRSRRDSDDQHAGQGSFRAPRS
jgi:thiopeptide-type bacteriocin biosynthesis protein